MSDKYIDFNGVKLDINSNVNANGYWWRNFIAKNILAKKYYHDSELEQFNKGNEDEAFKMFVERVSGIFSTKELQLFMAKSLYTGNYILAGRSLYGAGAKGKFNSSMSNCFTAGHKVITKRGLVNIEDVVKGDIVLTHTGDWQLVNAVMERDYEGDLIKFKVQNGYDDITCTPNHKFLTNKDWERADRLLASNDKRVKNCSKITMPVELQYQKNYDNVDLKNVFDNEEYKIIEEDDKLRYQKNIDGNWRTYGNPINRYLKLDDDMMYFIGRWLGDGSITIREKQPYHSILRIVFNATTEQEAFERCKEIGVKHFGIEPSVRFTEQNVISMTFENPIIGEWFYQEFGKRCDGKYIPDKYLGDFNMAIGLLDSDGIILSHGAVSITLKNKRLIDWLRDTLYLNGVNTQNPYPTKHINTWSMLIATSIAKARLVPYMAKTYYDLRQGKVSITDTSYYTKVMDIEILENQQCKVYNLSVENDNSYTVNGIVCHNCYILDKPNDNIESIFDVAKRMARIFSFGGGCGIDISNLRPANAKVNNVARTSTGAVSFMNLYSAVGETIAQNSRRGALLIALDCNHPDIEDFLTIKQNNDKVQGANISIKFTDEFMKAVEDNQDVKLYFKVNATGEELTKTINAKEFFMKFCEAQYDYAEPGAIFIDSVRNWHLLSEYEDYKINVSNPCVTGDTLILTDKGNIPIKDLVDKEVIVWNGYEWSKVIPKVTGHNQPIMRIAFSNGYYVDCTLYHKFVLRDNTRVEAKDLQIGDMLATYTYYNKLYEEVEVTSIENKGVADTVYCMNEPINHTFIANGVITGNCSEFFGNSHNSCNLSSVNLYNFVLNPFTDKAEFNYPKFKQCLHNVVYIANEVLDYGYDTQPLDENRACIDDWRSIGIGVFGLADMFVALGIKYGSQKSKDVLDEIMQTMQNATLWASSKYAKEYKPFGKYDKEKTLNCPLLCNIDNELHEHIDKYGLANGTLLSIAPTGSIAMLFRESGGVEPYYKVSYERTTHQLEKENKKFAISMLAVEDMLKYHKHTDYSEEHIKEAFPFVVDTYDIKPKDRIDIQSIMQDYVDNAISSTINLKEEATVQDIYDLYMYAWKHGCKGITIFRDNCKRISILGKDHGETRDGKADTVISEDGNKSDVVVAKTAITKADITNPAKLNSITPIKRGNVKSLWGRTFLYHTACVPKFYVTVNIKNNEIFEVFVGADKGCQANISTITRMTSLALRSGVTVDEIVKNLNSAVCPACTNARYKGDKTITKSCASCIASAIIEMQKTLNNGKNDVDTVKNIVAQQPSVPKKLTMNIKPMMKCPECGEPTLVPDGKCAYCSNCGYSKCD